MYRWGGIAEIRLSCSSQTCSIIFYGSPKLKVTMQPPTSPRMSSQDDGADFGAASVAAQGGLKLAREVMCHILSILLKFKHVDCYVHVKILTSMDNITNLQGSHLLIDAFLCAGQIEGKLSALSYC